MYPAFRCGARRGKIPEAVLWGLPTLPTLPTFQISLNHRTLAPGFFSQGGGIHGGALRTEHGTISG
jgi:hypothetical protein